MRRSFDLLILVFAQLFPTREYRSQREFVAESRRLNRPPTLRKVHEKPTVLLLILLLSLSVVTEAQRKMKFSRGSSS